MNPAKDGANFGKGQRVASLVSGIALVALGIVRKSTGGTLLALAGGGLLYGGLSGHFPACALFGAKKEEGSGAELQKPPVKKNAPGHGGVLVTKVVTIDKSSAELYAFWRDFTNLPKIMQHLESVETLSQTRSRWTAKAPAAQSVSWEAEIERDEPGKLIAWRSVEGSTIENSGSVRFSPTTGDRGTQVKIALEYKPPGGALGVVIAKLFGEEPQQQIEEDLNRFRQLMETGEVATNGREDED